MHGDAGTLRALCHTRMSTAGSGAAGHGSMTLQHERDNVYRLELRGLLRKQDLDRCQEQLIAEITRDGPVRLLLLLCDFAGWEPRADWNDLSFYVRHGASIERIAIVGPERWRSETLMFAGADLRKAAVEYFDEGALPDARGWLTS